ncbi:MAG TPA: peptidoglycan DD-metalloendopeptidase family protein [Puia sp.]|jgi:murein DD-endopeptidase MepM/ murein hydrolase activator NlpD|nr:peptidoglycan DD-metalloendopeptidase family protein [Puia sp.]
MGPASLISTLQERRQAFHPVVPFDPGRDKLYPFDFTDDNKDLSPEQIADTESFAAYINNILKLHHCKYGFGGYGEHRTLYARSKHFDQSLASGTGSEAARTIEEKDEPRRFHLGIDIWGPAGTKVMAPLEGIIHSFAFNNNDSDYGATLILTHNLDGYSFHTLYGHLSLNSLKNLHEGKRIREGDVIGEFGMRFENGNWPPHLHFQVIRDMQGWKGDYPGVCKYSERQQWLDNCPDPDGILQMKQYIQE